MPWEFILYDSIYIKIRSRQEKNTVIASEGIGWRLAGNEHKRILGGYIVVSYSLTGVLVTQTIHFSKFRQCTFYDLSIPLRVNFYLKTNKLYWTLGNAMLIAEVESVLTDGCNLFWNAAEIRQIMNRQRLG